MLFFDTRTFSGSGTRGSGGSFWLVSGGQGKSFMCFFFFLTIVFTLCFWAFIRDNYCRSLLVYQTWPACPWAAELPVPPSPAGGVHLELSDAGSKQKLGTTAWSMSERSWDVLEIHLTFPLPWEDRSGLEEACLGASPQVALLMTAFPFLVFSSHAESTPVIDHINVHTQAVRKPLHSSLICR